MKHQLALEARATNRRLKEISDLERGAVAPERRGQYAEIRQQVETLLQEILEAKAMCA